MMSPRETIKGRAGTLPAFGSLIGPLSSALHRGGHGPSTRAGDVPKSQALVRKRSCGHCGPGASSAQGTDAAPPGSPGVGGGPAAPGGRRQHGRLRRGQESWRRRRCLRQRLAPGYGPVAGYPGREYPQAWWWCRICQRADRSLVSSPHVVRLSGSLMATASRPRQLPLVGCAPERASPPLASATEQELCRSCSQHPSGVAQAPRTALPWGWQTTPATDGAVLGLRSPAPSQGPAATPPRSWSRPQDQRSRSSATAARDLTRRRRQWRRAARAVLVAGLSGTPGRAGGQLAGPVPRGGRFNQPGELAGGAGTSASPSQLANGTLRQGPHLWVPARWCKQHPGQGKGCGVRAVSRRLDPDAFGPGV